MTLTALRAAELRTATACGIPGTIVFADDNSRHAMRAIPHTGMREERDGGYVQKRTLALLIPAAKIAKSALLDSEGRIRTRTFTHVETGLVYSIDSDHPMGGVMLSPAGQYYTLRASQVVP